MRVPPDPHPGHHATASQRRKDDGSMQNHQATRNLQFWIAAIAVTARMGWCVRARRTAAAA